MFNKIKKFFHTKDGVEQKEINKQLLITVVSVFFTVISVIGVSLAAFVWSDNSEKEQKLVVGNISLAISSDSAPLGSGLNYPVNDADVDSLEPYTFTITNNGSLAANYTIKLVDDTAAITSDGCADNQIDKSYIYGKVSGAASISNTSLTDLMSVSLDTGMLKPGQSKTYNLRLWIHQSAPNSVIGGHFHGKIQLETSQVEGAEPTSDVVVATTLALEDSEIKTKSQSFPITVSNTTSEHLNTTIKLTNISIDDALKDVDFRWGLYNADTGVGLSFGIFKYSENSGEETIYRDSIIDAGAADKNYILRIWLHDDGTDQAELLNKNFSANIEIVQEPIEYTPESCFVFDSSTGTITGYDEVTCGTDVVIPRTINNVDVTKIGDLVFNYDEDLDNGLYITSAIIPVGITTIGDAFSGNTIGHITIPEGVTSIGQGSFSYCGLSSIFIPESVTSLLDFALAGNEIVSIIIPGNTNMLGSPFESMESKSILLMDGIEIIKNSVFYNVYYLESIEIPSSVMTVEESAFDECHNLMEIVVRGKSSLEDFEDYSGLTTDGYLPEGVNIVFRP